MEKWYIDSDRRENPALLPGRRLDPDLYFPGV